MIQHTKEYENVLDMQISNGSLVGTVLEQVKTFEGVLVKYHGGLYVYITVGEDGTLRFDQSPTPQDLYSANIITRKTLEAEKALAEAEAKKNRRKIYEQLKKEFQNEETTK